MNFALTLFRREITYFLCLRVLSAKRLDSSQNETVFECKKHTICYFLLRKALTRQPSSDQKTQTNPTNLRTTVPHKPLRLHACLHTVRYQQNRQGRLSLSAPPPALPPTSLVPLLATEGPTTTQHAGKKSHDATSTGGATGGKQEQAPVNLAPRSGDPAGTPPPPVSSERAS